ncbi:alpha/beta fold hydrolase [Candidatus Frankia alpina]|nr:alpha/beta hydrolase [Candidatus Frankia alpina]
MVSASGWRLPGAAGLELHVEDMRPDGDRPPGSTAPPGAPREEAGVEDGPVVLVHGIAGSTADWAAVAPELAASRHVVAYDHRGHGASGRAPGGRADYTFDLLLADLTAVVATLGPARIHLIGHSLGGVIALRYALEHPGRVRSLVLVDTAAAPATATGPVARRIVAAVLGGVAAIASRTGANSVNGRGEAVALAALGRELAGYPSLVPRLGEITAPTTVIVGERDSMLRASAQTLAHGIQAAHLAVIAEAGHCPHISRPLAWLAAVVDHLARAEAAVAGGALAG